MSNAYPYYQYGQQPSAQSMFLPPQGNVYFINSSLEMANVPMGQGVSVAICNNEGIMYLKSYQNGQPSFVSYKLEPYQEDNKKTTDTNLQEKLASIEKRLSAIEKGGKINDLL